MKKHLLSIVLLYCYVMASAQIDCSTGRYYSSVFSNVKITTDIVYGNNVNYWGLAEELKMDIYEPLGDLEIKRPFILLAHGGEFMEGTKKDSDIVVLSRSFAKMGYVVASVNYRLFFLPIDATQGKRAAYRAVQDMKAAIRYIRKDVEINGNTFKIDTNYFFIGGTSAGAITALHVVFMNKYPELVPAIDTTGLGDLDGNSGNPGYHQSIKSVINLSGALLDRNYIETTDNITLINMHGSTDNVVPYSHGISALISGLVLDGSYEIERRCLQIDKPCYTYSFWGQNHIPYYQNNDTTVYIDTVVSFVKNRLYETLGCICTDPYPLANTIIDTTILNNIALNKPVVADDLQVGNSANLAVDGSMNTRWGSNFSEPHFLVIDLLANYNISKFVVNWEMAYARKYQIQVSTDSVQWNTIVEELNSNGGNDQYVVNTFGRYLKINCIQRATSYGFSIYEFEAYGVLEDLTHIQNGNISKNTIIQAYPNPFNETIHVEFPCSKAGEAKASIFDTQGRLLYESYQPIISGINYLEWNSLLYLPAGVYLLRIETESENRYVKMVKNK